MTGNMVEQFPEIRIIYSRKRVIIDLFINRDLIVEVVVVYSS